MMRLAARNCARLVQHLRDDTLAKGRALGRRVVSCTCSDVLGLLNEVYNTTTLPRLSYWITDSLALLPLTNSIHHGK